MSWCKCEFKVGDPKLVQPFSDSDAQAPRDTPPLNIMSIAVRSIVNHEHNRREIITASLRIWENSECLNFLIQMCGLSTSCHISGSIDSTTPPEKQPSSSHTFVRPLGRYPPGFENRARAQKRSKIIPAPNERALLGQVLGMRAPLVLRPMKLLILIHYSYDAKIRP